MNLRRYPIETDKLCSATVYFFDKDTKEIIEGKWNDGIIVNMPKVVLYKVDDHNYVNLFSDEDKTPIFKRSNFSSGKMIAISPQEQLKTGACYVLDNYRDYFPFYNHTCTKDELIDSILLNPDFFLYRPELARYKITEMEKAATKAEQNSELGTIVRDMKYLQKLMKYYSIEYHDSNKREDFYKYFKTLSSNKEQMNDRKVYTYKK